MRRPSPQRQQGFGLLVFIIVTTVVALAIVLGYSGIMARAQSNQLVNNQQKYLAAARTSVQAFYERNAYTIDEQSMSNPTTIAQILAGAGVPVRYDLQAALSRVLVSPEGLPYRAVALWLPSETDATNPPNVANFTNTGTFVSCSNASTCAVRQVEVFDSLNIERANAKRAMAQLQQIALKAQSYFKARLLQDPERNVSVNYFRAPSGVCQAQPMDLECLDNYTPLTTSGAGSAAVPSTTAKNLGLSDAELISPWGRPIEASNLVDSITDDTPYAMSFRIATPAGLFYKVKAVEQL
jgi:type II secretory pathway pseudopilin PulG